MQKKVKKKGEFSDPGGAPPKHPGSRPNAGNLHEEEDHPKEREQENKKTLKRKDPRLGPCGPERILGGFGVVWGVILGAKGRPKWLQNLIKKMSDFWIALGSALGRQRAG